jgi:hypothetical protein
MARRRKGGVELRSSRTTLRYGFDALTEEEIRQLRIWAPHAHYYTHMLVDDVSLRVLPNSLRRSGGAAAVLEPPGEAAAGMVAQALARERDYFRRDLGDAVHDFFRHCATTLVTYLRAPYEIAYLSPPDSEAVVGFELVPVYPPTLFVEDEKFVQYVPQRWAESGRFPRRIEVAPDRLVVFDLPGEFREDWPQALHSLMAVEQGRGVDLALESFKVGRERLPYDFQAHKRSEFAAVAEATRCIGWDARGTFQDEQTEYYRIHRHLTFLRFLIQLRDSLLEKLNATLDTVSRVLPPLGHLRLEGVPTAADVEQALRHLQAGDKPFKDILAPFSLL